jgi:hypothetical protein
VDRQGSGGDALLADGRLGLMGDIFSACCCDGIHHIYPEDFRVFLELNGSRNPSVDGTGEYVLSVLRLEPTLTHYRLSMLDPVAGGNSATNLEWPMDLGPLIRSRIDRAVDEAVALGLFPHDSPPPSPARILVARGRVLGHYRPDRALVLLETSCLFPGTGSDGLEGSAKRARIMRTWFTVSGTVGSTLGRPYVDAMNKITTSSGTPTIAGVPTGDAHLDRWLQLQHTPSADAEFGPRWLSDVPWLIPGGGLDHFDRWSVDYRPGDAIPDKTLVGLANGSIGEQYALRAPYASNTPYPATVKQSYWDGTTIDTVQTETSDVWTTGMLRDNFGANVPTGDRGPWDVPVKGWLAWRTSCLYQPERGFPQCVGLRLRRVPIDWSGTTVNISDGFGGIQRSYNYSHNGIRTEWEIGIAEREGGIGATGFVALTSGSYKTNPYGSGTVALGFYAPGPPPADTRRTITDLGVEQLQYSEADPLYLASGEINTVTLRHADFHNGASLVLVRCAPTGQPLRDRLFVRGVESVLVESGTTLASGWSENDGEMLGDEWFMPGVDPLAYTMRRVDQPWVRHLNYEQVDNVWYRGPIVGVLPVPSTTSDTAFCVLAMEYRRSTTSTYKVRGRLELRRANGSVVKIIRGPNGSRSGDIHHDSPVNLYDLTGRTLAFMPGVDARWVYVRMPLTETNQFGNKVVGTHWAVRLDGQRYAKVAWTPTSGFFWGKSPLNAETPMMNVRLSTEFYAPASEVGKPIAEAEQVYP